MTISGADDSGSGKFAHPGVSGAGGSLAPSTLDPAGAEAMVPGPLSAWGRGRVASIGVRSVGTYQRDQLREQAVGQILVSGVPQEGFDRLTRLALNVFDVPISVITLLDTERARPVSGAGMPAGEAPSAETFYETTAALEHMVIVEDARGDERFAGLPAVAGEPGIRFYAGCPITDANGIVVGTFCLFAFEPRTLDEREQDLLTELASWARQELMGSADTRRAREVQQKLLPSHRAGFAGYDIAAICLPSLTVGGDFYDYTLADGMFRFCVADVMGKGIGAAIITATVRAAMRAASERFFLDRLPDAAYSPGEVLTITNRAMQHDLEDTGSLVTVFAASIDGASGTVRYADAGHGLTVLARNDGSVQWLESLDPPLGIDAGTVWGDQETELRRGDTLLSFSDGLLDVYGDSGVERDEIARLVQDQPEPRDLTEYLRQLTRWGAPGDDVTALAVRRRAGT
jgi:phosphoserine phosphatase RsbU/P